MKTPKANYWLDVVIGIAFVLSGVSGLVFLAPATDGGTVLGLGYALWSDVHTWSSLLMIGGVGIHLAQHWRWIVAMTRRQLGRAPAARATMVRAPQTVLAPVPVDPATRSSRQALMSRRGFLVLGGGVTVWAGLMAASLGVIARSLGAAGAGPGTAGAGLATATGSAGTSDAAAGAATANAPAATAAPTVAPVARATVTAAPEVIVVEPVRGVACRKGYVNDPFPGHCHDYTDRDGDGICDYSVLGSGSQPATRNG